MEKSCERIWKSFFQGESFWDSYKNVFTTRTHDVSLKRNDKRNVFRRTYLQPEHTTLVSNAMTKENSFMTEQFHETFQKAFSKTTFDE